MSTKPYVMHCNIYHSLFHTYPTGMYNSRYLMSTKPYVMHCNIYITRSFIHILQGCTIVDI